MGSWLKILTVSALFHLPPISSFTAAILSLFLPVNKFTGKGENFHVPIACLVMTANEMMTSEIRKQNCEEKGKSRKMDEIRVKANNYLFSHR